MTAARVMEPGVRVAANDEPRASRTIGVLDCGVFGGSVDAASMLKPQAESWIAAAKAGDELLYAEGRKLPKWSKTPEYMRSMAAAGFVALVQERPGRGLYHYIAQRTDRPWNVPAAAGVPGIRARADDEIRLLKLLAEYADVLPAKARPCPSNAELAALLQLTDGSRASYLLGCLERDGTIMREATAWMPGRIITFVADGAATGIVDGVPKR